MSSPLGATTCHIFSTLAVYSFHFSSPRSLSERYVGSKMREIIRIDHERVYMTFETREEYQFTLYDINDGQWYYINMQWSSDTGVASVMVNSVKVIGVTSHGKGWTVPDL